MRYLDYTAADLEEDVDALLVWQGGDGGTVYTIPMKAAVLAKLAASPHEAITGGTTQLAPTDYYVPLNLTGAAIIEPPDSPNDGQELVIKDETGACGTYAATLSGFTVDGILSPSINIAYGWFRIRYSAALSDTSPKASRWLQC